MSEEQRQERVVVTTIVAVEPRAAFTVFTRDIDAWWKRSPRYRGLPGQAGALRFEGAPPARLVEVEVGADREHTRVLGRVLAWEEGARVAFEWHGGELSAEDRTEVEVRFEPHAGGTRVTLEHRGLGALPLGHPARRGFSGEAFEAMFGYFWADLLVGYRLRCA